MGRWSLLGGFMGNQPVATSGAGSWLQTGNSFLSSALETWGKVEEIKAARSSSGNDQTSRLMQPDYANGAAVQVDAMAQPKADEKPSMYKNGLMILGGILAVGLLLKMSGYK